LRHSRRLLQRRTAISSLFLPRSAEKNARDEKRIKERGRGRVISYSITISSNFDVNDLLALHYAINTATPPLPAMRKVWTRAHEWQRLIEAASGRGRARCISYLPTGRRVRRRELYDETRHKAPTAAAAAVIGCNNETRPVRGRTILSARAP